MASPMKRFGGYVVTNEVDRRQGGKAAGVEMRRTRMFCKLYFTFVVKC